MKKVFLFLSAITLVATSACSSGDDSTAPVTPTDNVLVKRAVYQQAGAEGFNFTIDYVYDGNKLVKEVYDDGSVGNYFYTGNLITKIEYVVDGEIDQRETMTYNSDGKLASYKVRFLEDSFDAESYTYTYGGDNTVTTEGTNGGSLITLINDELAHEIYTSGVRYTYTFDTKNSPFKNVTGFAAVAYALAGDHILHGRFKNIVSIVNDTHNQNYMMNTFTYNSANYPTMVKSTAIFEYDNPVPSAELTVIYSY